MSVKLKIKKGDNVVVITGDSKGKVGKVVEVDKINNRAVVEGVNIVKKHSKPNAKFPQGGIVEIAAPINISNLMFSESGKATRVGRRIENDKVVRYSKKSGNTIK
jgi:large subunit ribosomal protein L24